MLFDQSNWKIRQGVSCKWRGAADLIDDKVILSITASGGGYDGVSESFAFTIRENNLLVLSSPFHLNLPEGSSITFSVRLSRSPTENVTITVSPDEIFNKINATFDTDADTSGDQRTLTFTPTNWNAWQTVRVSAAAGAFKTVNTDRYWGFLHITLPNGGYKSLVVVPIKANTDKAHFDMSPNMLILDEGSSQPLTIRMLSPPSSAITLTAGDLIEYEYKRISLDRRSVTFTPSNWNTPQTVTVSSLGDDDSSDERNLIGFRSLVPENEAFVEYRVSYLVRDNDLGLNVSPSSVRVDEGATVMFTVRLNSRPSGTVTVNVLPPPESDLTVDTDPYKAGNQDSLTFTTESWSTPQTVIVTAAEDEDYDGRIDGVDVSLNVLGNETDYAGQTATLRVNILGESNDPIIEMASDPLVVPEGGSATFTVRMSQPINSSFKLVVKKYRPKRFRNNDVTIDTNPHKAGNQRNLRFTPENWNIPQTVTVSAAEDDDLLFETELLSFTDAVSTTLGMIVADNDTAGLVLSTTSLNIPEGGGNDFSVVLTTQPSADVTVTLVQESPDNADVTLDESSLTFTSDNWNTPQTVRVSAGQDDDAIDDSAAISLAASGGGYGNLSPRRVAVTVNEDDEAGLTLSPGSLTIPEGDEGSFTVQLASKPSENVTVTLTQPSNIDVTADTDTATTGNQSTLTFTAANWNQAQTVTVGTLRDDDTLDDRA
ncbi:MAG: hypothetical protein ISN29_02830, partial [Gammaproteobacteria bacterium AqS3]|nr:hypothetical protein [Gammaproteobacteria bacterium AqS3]